MHSGELCDYNGGQWKHNECKFGDDKEAQERYENKLDAYWDTSPEEVKEREDAHYIDIDYDEDRKEICKEHDGMEYGRRM